ncbi:unnamed protein product [Didymodactylos carnosus]|uniref:Uncharacterized protein n=1 Tax=Didymodactylos carnosus TaxID=1234261 RepID=A0A815Y838_9BILA|nr:unnamed protein product [Didymodactylos carnosus]CAF1566826.1 unnamed protein product [Didymodactylos carnosus]CAF4258634.1 unnamed protein product [Didymodactylos carnosus]CAF4429166.1 unnamed protein product [Didymodactylos carnosus]
MNDNVAYDSSAIPYFDDDRDLSRYSDHLTVWLDKYIGRPEESVGLKAQFKTITQPLETLNKTEEDVDETPNVMINPDMLEKLKDRIYCVKAFFDPAECLKYIRSNSDKKIFFISSGSMGEKIVPDIAALPQIHGVYIFCGNISHHVKTWAMEYVDNISAMLEHQDDLLVRLTKDIAEYLQNKGDHHFTQGENVKARNCYAWATKLILRTQQLGDTNYKKPLTILNAKREKAESSCESSQ